MFGPATANVWVALLIVALVIVLAIVAIVSARKHVKPFDIVENDIPRFKVDAHWDPYPTTVNVENQYDCTAESLRKCALDDPTTLFGCKELAVRCHHFDKDTPYFSNGVKTIIPKNEKPNEGYALAITSLVDACNPYHGDLTLVAKNAASTDYMLICTCKEPGYIGNEDILGSCETVYICNGKIDDINKPLNEIQCICNEREINVRYEDGLPVCKTLLVHEANERYDDWTHLVPFANPDATLDKKLFNATIRDNLNATKLIDPCKRPLDAKDPKETVVNGVYQTQTKSCFVGNYGIPARVNMLEPYNQKEEDRYAPYHSFDAVISSDAYETIRLIDRVGGKRMQMNVKAKLRAYKKGSVFVHVNLPENIGLGDPGQVKMTMKGQMIGGRCEGDWPTYHCYMKEYFSDFRFDVPYTGYRSAPGSFWWGTDDWDNVELMIPDGQQIRINGVMIDNKTMMKVDDVRSYGIRYCSIDAGPLDDKGTKCLTGMLSFNNHDDYEKHKSIVT